MNRPYVKQYDSNGILINPIVGEFINLHPNRSERRENLNKSRLYNNKKGIQTVVTRVGRFIFSRYTKEIQVIDNKQIVHFREA